MGIARDGCMCLDNDQENRVRWAFDRVPTFESGELHPRGPIGNLSGCAHANKTRRLYDGLTVVGSGWIAHVGHQQECAFAMAQAVQLRLARRMHYYGELTMTPFVNGVLDSMHTPLERIRLAKGTLYCYDAAAFCIPKKFAAGEWHSMRASRLLPQMSGQLVVPTRQTARWVAQAAQDHCNVTHNATAASSGLSSTPVARRGAGAIRGSEKRMRAGVGALRRTTSRPRPCAAAQIDQAKACQLECDA
jgi:hypothetical protein